MQNASPKHKENFSPSSSLKDVHSPHPQFGASPWNNVHNGANKEAKT